MIDKLPLTCWACGAHDAADDYHGPICKRCYYRLLSVFGRRAVRHYDDFTCEGDRLDMNKGHMWHMLHHCAAEIQIGDRAWCWCGREIVMPGTTPRWETELNDILQRLGVAQ